jgi:hypothetical protein
MQVSLESLEYHKYAIYLSNHKGVAFDLVILTSLCYLEYVQEPDCFDKNVTVVQTTRAFLSNFQNFSVDLFSDSNIRIFWIFQRFLLRFNRKLEYYAA